MFHKLQMHLQWNHFEDPAAANEFCNNVLLHELHIHPDLTKTDSGFQYRNTADGKFSAWLFRMAKNIFIDRIRRNHPERFVAIDDENMAELPDDSAFSPERELGASDTGKAIMAAIKQLPLEQREVFMLREQDLSFKEIAKIQNCSLNTALSRMRYALQTLRNYLSEFDRGGLIK